MKIEATVKVDLQPEYPSAGMRVEEIKITLEGKYEAISLLAKKLNFDLATMQSLRMF